MRTNNSKKGCSLEKIAAMKKLYPTTDNLLNAAAYYLEQVDRCQVDPVNWPEEILERAIDVFEMTLAADLSGHPRQLLSVNDNGGIDDIDPKDRIAVAHYQLKVILEQKRGR